MDERIQDPELLLIRRQKLELMEKKVQLLRQDGLPFYHPHPKQDAFHRSTAKRRGVFTGNRFGKSTMGCAEDCAWLRGERVWYPKDDPARTAGLPGHPVKGLVVTTDWPLVDEVWTSQRGTEGKIWRFLPHGFIKRSQRNHVGVICVVECANRSVLRFDTVSSWKNDPQGMESKDWDFIHVDEPIPQAMWTAISRGLIDRDGSAWFTLTALAEPWITDAFMPGGLFDGSAWSIEGTIYDNPYLTADAIKRFESTLTPDEVQCRLLGKPLHLAGLVYKQFSREKHLLTELPSGWRSWLEPPIDWSYYIYIDPHPRVPHCVLFLVVDPAGRKYYYFDLFEHCTIRTLCDRIKEVLAGRRLIRARCDPAAFIEDPRDLRTIADDFAEEGIFIEKASKDLARGIVRTQEELQFGQMYFTPMCRRTLWEITRYHWDEKTNRPVDADDHAMECLYRSVLDEPTYIDPRWPTGPVDDIEIPRMPSLRLEDLEFS